MKCRRSLLAVGLLAALSASVTAKPPGGPTNPHGTGKEPTPIEREFHHSPTAEPRLTDPVPMLPAQRIAGDMLHALRLLPAWFQGLL